MDRRTAYTIIVIAMVVSIFATAHILTYEQPAQGSGLGFTLTGRLALDTPTSGRGDTTTAPSEETDPTTQPAPTPTDEPIPTPTTEPTPATADRTHVQRSSEPPRNGENAGDLLTGKRAF